MSYDTVYTGGSGEIVEKKSRFIAQVFPVETEEEVLQILEETRKKYWDARHNCYAFVLGAGGEITRCSDDGEPSGTAGRPILEVLTGRRLRNVLVIVTRYFGGTLLGTGGLVRAYSQSAQAGIAASRVITKQAGCLLTVDTDYNGIGKLQYLAAQSGLAVLDTVYTESVQMKVLVPTELCGSVQKEITEATSGQAGISQDEAEVYFACIDKEIVVFDA
ncbi:YigZ family protein [bacterium 1xD8-6]|nr:YigZ family protein [bacterium D16-36]RKI73501.1 YigZ family protein [bacterium 1xD8-6]